jgi:hypothetical protein
MADGFTIWRCPVHGVMDDRAARPAPLPDDPTRAICPAFTCGNKDLERMEVVPRSRLQAVEAAGAAMASAIDHWSGFPEADADVTDGLLNALAGWQALADPNQKGEG